MGNPEEKTLLERLRHRRDNIKMNIKEIGRDGVDVIDLLQHSRNWRAVMKAVMNLGFQKKHFFYNLRLLKKDPAALGVPRISRDRNLLTNTHS
jgi:hypothetical protein